MIKTLYYSGLISTTLVAALIVLVVALASCLRRVAGSDSNRIAGTVVGLLGSWAFLAFVAFGTFLNTGYGIYKGYVVPRDYMQDVISAREFMDGKSLYPDDMTRKFIEAVNNSPPRLSIWPEGSIRRLEEREARDQAASSPWVQAHPPIMTLFFAPLVRSFGTYGTFFAISMLSIASLLSAPVLLARTLGLRLPMVALASLALAILGWAATIEDLRDGQSGPYLMFLCLLGWSFLRSGRPVLAGVVIGIATCLKLYPGLILVYFLLKDRRAFISGVTTVAAGLSLSCILCGPRVFVEYLQTAQFVGDYYSTYSSNISLLACLLRIAGTDGNQTAPKVVWFALGVTCVLGAMLATRYCRAADPDESRSIDLGFSFFLSLSVLLTPVAWDHYTVLLLLPLAILAQRELHAQASRASSIGFLVLIVIMATPFGTFAFARSSLSSHIDDYLLRITLLNIRTVSIMALIGWLAWSYALEQGLFPRLVSGRASLATPEIKHS